VDWVVVFTAVAGAFAAPAWFVLRWMDSPSRRPWVRPGQAVGISLFLVWAVNFASLVWGALWSSSVWFAAMNWGFLGSAGAGWATVLVAGGLTGRKPHRSATAAFAILVLGLWLVGLYRSFLLPGETPIFRYGEVFTMGTLAGSSAVVWALTSLVLHRKDLAPGVRRELPWVFTVLTVLAAWAVAADVFALDQVFFGRDLPMSPLFLGFAALLCYRSAAVWWRLLVVPEVPESLETWCRSLGISAREREVLELLASGRDRNAVAQMLFISPVTVKNHLASLYRKTGTSDQGALIQRIRDF